MVTSLDTFASGLPEFFVTDIRAESLPGNCLRFVFIHPIDGDAVVIVVPYSCWLEWRLELAKFALERAMGSGQETRALPH